MAVIQARSGPGSRYGVWGAGSDDAFVTPLTSLGPQEMVMIEIEVMNQLNHRNLIQLYAAIETQHDIILFME